MFFPRLLCVVGTFNFDREFFKQWIVSNKYRQTFFDGIILVIRFWQQIFTLFIKSWLFGVTFQVFKRISIGIRIKNKGKVNVTKTIQKIYVICGQQNQFSNLEFVNEQKKKNYPRIFHHRIFFNNGAKPWQIMIVSLAPHHAKNNKNVKSV